MSGTVICQKRCHAVPPSMAAALCRSSGTSARPAMSSSAMKGTVFQTSARMMIHTESHLSVSGALLPARYPRFSVHAKRQENAATTVTIA